MATTRKTTPPTRVQKRKTVKPLPIHSRVQVKRARLGTGLGLFAMDLFKKGEMVIEYTGKKIKTKHADTLGTKYLFEIDTEWTIDGSTRTNLARYVNHACAPNCEAEIDGTRIFYNAVRKIHPGEELTVDYGEEYFNEFIKPHGCMCVGCTEERGGRKK